jgi:SPP1 gp7 family putative phage head morphogenesis protein
VFSTEKQAMIAAVPNVGKIDRSAWETAFTKLWVMVGSDGWKFSEDMWGAAQEGKKYQVKPKAIWEMYLKATNPAWLQYVQDYIDETGAEKITEISDTTKKAVKAALKEGIANEESIPALSKRIADVYDGFAGYRSTLIARSETVDAFNQASLAQARDADSTLDLCWITAGDDRVRPEHEDMDGETVAYDAEFDCADGTTMPGEAENCRCTIGYAVPEVGDNEK